jgi:hypothetical protein
MVTLKKAFACIVVFEHITRRPSRKGKCARKTLEDNAKCDQVQTTVFLFHCDDRASSTTCGATSGDIETQSKSRRGRLPYSRWVQRDDGASRRKPAEKSSSNA